MLRSVDSPWATRQAVRLRVLGLLVTLALLAPLAAAAQPPAKVPRVGYLSVSPVLVEAFRQGLRELGYVEGKNLAVEL